MSAVIGALRAELSASIAQFQSDMGKAADSLKGFSKAAKGIAKDLDDVGKKMSLAITAPLALLAKASLDQAKEAREAIGQVEAAITSTGGSVGRTLPQLQALAKGLQNISVFDDDDILKNVTANLVTFGNVQGPIFEKAQKAIVNLASRMGGDLAGASIKVGRALNDPIQGTQALTRLGVQFTTAQKEQIKALVTSGQGMKAQTIILDALEKKFGGAALALRKASPDAQLAQSWRDFEETIGHIEMQLLPALTGGLRGVLDAFQALTPDMQKFIVEGAAILATVGPVLVLLGRLASVVGTLIPLVKGLWVALMPYAAGLLVIAAAVGVLVAAIIASQRISDQATGAIKAGVDAQKGYTDALSKAATAARTMTAAERDAAAQKLKLAENTLKAALAQEQQNLAENEQRMSGGTLSKSWEDLKNLAHGEAPPEIKMVQQRHAIEQLKGALDGLHKSQQELFADAAAPAEIKLHFDPHNEAEIAKAKGALKSLDEQLTQMNINLQHGLDDLALPKAAAQANALNARLDDYVKQAQAAGANTGAFADRIGALRVKIGELEQAGLAKEAQEFAAAVDQEKLAVDRFAKGGLPPLAERLQDVDDQFKSLHDKIADEIEKNKALADSNDDARAAMDRLQDMLAHLEDAHAKATAAATAQYEAEKKLSDLQAMANNLETKNQVRDLMAATGQGSSPISSLQQDLQDANDDLAKKQIEVQQNLVKLEEDRDAAAARGDEDEAKRKQSEIDLQQQLYDLVQQTTGGQLMAAKRVNEAFKEFTDNLTDSLSDMIANWSFDLKGLMAIFRQLAEQLFIKPGVSALAEGLGGWLKGIMGSFGGAHAAGGMIPPGQWGIVGEEGPEIAYGGAAGMDVFPHGSDHAGRNVTQIFNISTPDANSFRAAKRQIGRAAKLGLGI